MSGPGYITIPVQDALGVNRNVLFWSSDGTELGDVVVCQQPTQFVPTPPNPWPSTISAETIFDSGVITSAGFRYVSAGLTLSQDGSVTIERYLDSEGTVKGAPDAVQDLTADTPGYINLNDGMPFSSFRIIITNSSDSIATMSQPAVLLGS